MNYTTIGGHLGSDPETRFTPSGKKVISLRVACKARKNGKDETMWWRVTIWGETFDKILPYFKKGSPIVVCGEIMPPDIYQNREGVTQVSMGITANHISFSPFGRNKGSEDQPGNMQATQEQNYGPAQSSQEETQAYASAANKGEIPEEEIPF